MSLLTWCPELCNDYQICQICYIGRHSLQYSGTFTNAIPEILVLVFVHVNGRTRSSTYSEFICKSWWQDLRILINVNTAINLCGALILQVLGDFLDRSRYIYRYLNHGESRYHFREWHLLPLQGEVGKLLWRAHRFEATGPSREVYIRETLQ